MSNDMTAKEISRLLDVIEREIVPKTAEGVKSGSKLFGAAILRKSDLSVVISATNTETANPLLHGEVTAINNFYELKERPLAKDCVFLATHEPCSLCLSAITWSGFDNFSYFFTYEDSRAEFDIPYDIDILEQVFQVADPGTKHADPDRELYNRKNKYFTSTSLKTEILKLDDPQLIQRIEQLTQTYRELSSVYQRSKGQLVLA